MAAKANSPRPTVAQNTNSRGRAIRAGQNALHDGKDEHGQQHVGGPVVDRPQQPSADHLVLHEIDAFPGRLGAGAIIGPEKEAGDRLRAEGEENDHARQTLHQHGPPGTGDWASRPHQSPNPVRSLNQEKIAFIVHPDKKSLRTSLRNRKRLPYSPLSLAPSP